MTRKILATTFALLAVALLSACSDSGNTEEVPLPDVTGASVELSALSDAVWGDLETASADAKCVASSSFIVSPGAGFDIMRNPSLTKELKSKVIVVSPIMISFPDAATDGRGADCTDGTLSYLIPVSESAVIGIESSDAVRARQNLEILARATPTDYPRCTIVAHFERAGIELCEDAEEPPADEEVVEETPADDEEDAADDAADDDAADDEDADDDGPIIVSPIGGLKPIGSINLSKAMALDDEMSCGPEEVRTVKLVIDDVNCRLQP